MYRFYLDGVLLPVTPSKLTVSIKNKNKTLDLINWGEINVLKKPGLSEFSFEALLPLNLYPFAVYESGFKKPDYYLEHLKNLNFIINHFDSL